MKWLLTVSVIAAAALVLAACGAAPKTTTSTSPTTPATTPPGGISFGQLADAGRPVFTANCASCHGNNGQGVTAPPVIGSSAQLAKYQTAQGLLAFVDTNMPFNNPGGLSQTQYLQVLAYLLVQNSYVTQSTAFINEGQLGAISLK